jgi:hypothetical protein
MSPIFSSQRVFISSLVKLGRAYKWGFQATALTTLAIPIFFSAKLDDFSKGSFLLTAVTASACWKATEKTSDRHESFDKAFDQEQLVEFKRHGKITAKFREAEATIDAYNSLRDKVVAQPFWAWGRWVDQFGLKGLLPPIDQAVPEQAALMPDWTATAIAPGSLQSVDRVVPQEPPASVDWIVNLVELTAEPDPEKRRNHHIVIQGPTQYGKSTLCSFILILLAKRLNVLGLDLKIHLIDPKYPMSKWFIEPGFKGYEEAYEGVVQIRKELEARKKVFVAAKRQKQKFPRVGFYASITDEWDNCWCEGAGYGSGTVITKEQAKEMKATELTVFKEGAAFNMCNIMMGQSPLKETSGFNHSDMNNATRIVLGIEARKWLKHPAFPFKDMAEPLEAQICYWMSRDERFALVVPNNGLPFVAPLPREVKLVVEQFESGKDILAESVEAPKPIEPSEDWYEQFQKWAIASPQEPSGEQILAKLEELLNKTMTTDELDFLLAEVRTWRKEGI